MEKDEKIRTKNHHRRATLLNITLTLFVTLVTVFFLYFIVLSFSQQPTTDPLKPDVRKIQQQHEKKGKDDISKFSRNLDPDEYPIMNLALDDKDNNKSGDGDNSNENNVDDKNLEQYFDEKYLASQLDKADRRVRDIKKSFDKHNNKGKEAPKFMETDPKALVMSRILQEATRLLLAKRYGVKEPYRVQINLQFQSSMKDFKEKGSKGKIILEMAPSALQPHSIYTFLEVARNWRGGAFHRVAGHVLQVEVSHISGLEHLAFQEYSAAYPHKRGTVGYAGRPSGTAWYVSIMNNSVNHGPGSQQKFNPHEADSCFGKVVEGFEDVVMDRITQMNGGFGGGMGFIKDGNKKVKIKSMQILVPDGGGDSSGDNSGSNYVPWIPNSENFGYTGFNTPQVS